MKAGTSNKSTRDTWVEKTLKSLPAGLKILDAGAGQQVYKQFCTHLQYVSQDFARYDGKGNGKGLQAGKWNCSDIDILCDIADIPEPDTSFDVVLCTEVFEHLPAPILVIKEFNRLLRSGGLLILTAPFCSLTHFAPYHYYSGYSRYFYQETLPNNGFLILELEANGNFFEYLAQETNRIQTISKRYAGDRPNILERFAMGFVIRMLERFSKRDKGSDELLCFGFHVLAKKI